MILLITIFVLGYIAIALEHKLGVNKSAIALVMAGSMWAIFVLFIPESATVAHSTAFKEWLSLNPLLESLPTLELSRRFITDFLLLEYMGDISSTLFFLIGAMTIVELIDAHGGFNLLTDKIDPKNNRRLLLFITTLTFFLSAVLDNLTTAIVMVTLVRKIVPNYKERWVFAGMIIIAANGGGAWSPIGDVTTIMLWIKGAVSSIPLIKRIFLPSLFSVAIPLLFALRLLKPKELVKRELSPEHEKKIAIGRTERKIILVLGVASLLSVPLFKFVTTLPPFAGIITALGAIWIYTDILYSNIKVSETSKYRVTKVLKQIDTSTILFFLGILLSVMSLSATGALTTAGQFLVKTLKESNYIAMAIGILSSVVDNVPLVAVAMGMFPIVADGAPHLIMDGSFWHLLAYSAGTGGSLLIIGSAAGVVVMGLERISFGWYLRHISLLALIGFISGIALFLLLN
ncbi:MAG: sodium:proton antiporter NhaD [Bacteroidales bacterium]